MNKKIFGVLIAAIFVISVVVVFPKTAVADSDTEKVTFIHYKDGTVKIGGGEKQAKQVICYKLMGVKWTTTPVSYVINPMNPQNMSPDFVTYAISTSAETCDYATSTELFNNEYTVDWEAQYGVRDYNNAIVFGAYPNNGVIAVTSIWYNKRTKQITEFDILFNTYFTWGDAEYDPYVMDLQNIATHELGHGVGLNDIYNSACSTVTMYGYSTEGETQKRTLEQPDVTGLQKMYGV